MRRILSLVLVLLCLASCAQAADVFGYSISDASGSVPADLTVTAELGADASAARLVCDNGTVLGGAVSFSTLSNGNKSWTLDATFDTAYKGTLTLQVKDTGGTWVDTDAVFDVAFTQSSGGAPIAVTPVPQEPTPTAAVVSWDTTGFYPGSIYTVDYSEDRIQSRTGPDSSFTGGGAYKTCEILSTSALYLEKYAGKTWVYVELLYQKGYYRRVYFLPKHFWSFEAPYVSFTPVAAVITSSVVPVFGPGPQYDNYPKVELARGFNVSALHEENDYIFIEFPLDGQMARAWVPEDCIEAR